MSEPGDRAGDQREFLLRSLEDLEREHQAGDLDDADYLVLKDDYTARAAAALRAERSAGSAPRRRGNRGFLALAGVLIFAALAGVLVAQSSGRRDAGDSATGSIDQSITQKLNEAGGCFSEGDADCAIELYDEVLDEQPTNAEALTYKAWVLHMLLGDTETALPMLVEATSVNPDYADAHALVAFVFADLGFLRQASAALERAETLGLPPDLLDLAEQLRTQLDAALAAVSTTTTTAG